MLTGYDLTAINSQNLEIAKETLNKRVKNKNIEELIKKAQGGDESAFLQVYEYYKPYTEYLFFKHGGALVEEIDVEELSTMYKMALIKSIQVYDRSVYGAMSTCIAEHTLRNLNILIGIANSKGKGDVSEIVSMDTNLSKKNGYSSVDMISSVRSYNENLNEVENETLVYRLLSLLDEKDRKWLQGYFESQRYSLYSNLIGLSRQRCCQIYDAIEAKLLKIKGKCDIIARDFYEENKSIGQIAEERGMKRAEVAYYVRLNNYIYNGGKLPKINDIKYSIAGCVLSSEEFEIFTKSMNRPAESLIDEYGVDSYQNVILPVVRKVKLAESKMNIVARYNECGKVKGDYAKKELQLMGENEKSFYALLYRYSYLGGDKPLMPKSASERLVKSLDGIAERNVFCG